MSPLTAKLINFWCFSSTILDSYLDYFTTPYFVFLRDALSYLVLLGLHFTICLQTSSISFSGIEWAILVFFTGRVLFESEQFASNKVKEKVKRKRRNFQRARCRGCKHLEEKGDEEERVEKPTAFTMRFSKYIRYPFLLYFACSNVE